MDQARLADSVRIPKAAELVATQLRDQIVRGQLRGGDALPPEATLIEQYGISRPTLREAFRVLESESLLTVRRGAHGGARVLEPSSDAVARYAGLLLQFEDTTLADLYDVASILEPSAVRLLAERATSEDVARLRVAAAQGEASSKNKATHVVSENEFHNLVVDLAGSNTLRLLSRIIHHILDKATYAATVDAAHKLRTPQMLRGAQRSHEQLIELIEQKDAAGAEEFWRRHVVRGGREILKQLPTKAALDIMR